MLAHARQISEQEKLNVARLIQKERMIHQDGTKSPLLRQQRQRHNLSSLASARNNENACVSSVCLVCDYPSLAAVLRLLQVTQQRHQQVACHGCRSSENERRCGERECTSIRRPQMHFARRVRRRLLSTRRFLAYLARIFLGTHVHVGLARS